MHMIRHHDHDAQIELRAVIVQAAFQDKRSHPLGKNRSPICAESYKVLLDPLEGEETVAGKKPQA
jgi:hypothetical protein